MTNHDNSQSNKNTSFPYSFSFHPLSRPTKQLLKITFFASFFISDSTVSRKMDHFDISFVIWKVSRSRQLTKPTLLDPVHLPGSHQQSILARKISKFSKSGMTKRNRKINFYNSNLIMRVSKIM